MCKKTFETEKNGFGDKKNVVFLKAQKGVDNFRTMDLRRIIESHCSTGI